MNVHALNELLLYWPEFGARSEPEARRLKRFAHHKLGVSVNPKISRAQLKTAITRLAIYIPYKYQQYLRPNVDLRQQAIKIQQGAAIPVSFNGADTIMHVESARRITYHGRPWYLEMRIKLNTEHIPIIIDRESKCACLYCGTNPVSDEESCRACGAPLPEC